ncbi:radical SAM protein [Peptostreptococcus canis]|uniref:Radical SAM protein n=1 Tax=Peptostreptococcus canis TaxID=1159213 RepID=A0ABR6TNR8_9FIRM|nr:radical SAM protein [Peptostreptococcus canis]MBC2576813.1 radical SAM protein [Peptostreptococcus canis]MBP1998883.1 cyclic pyranopterin phosphate synthase [Peptostreptococcus canis]
MDNNLSYLRVILTEENNYSLMYLQKEMDSEIITQDVQAMQIDDFKKIISYFAKRGLKKIKFVGGEPLLYKGLEELIEFSGSLGIDEIGITTNGIGLGTRILELKKLGLTNVNISLDSLKEYKYQALTNGGNLKEVFISIDACQAAGIKLKINCVAIKDFNDDELIDFMKLTINNDIDMRLIELLPYGIDKKVFERGYMDLKEFIDNTEGIYEDSVDDLSVSEYFKIYEAVGRIGIITTSSREFNEDLRRINISNRGYLNVGPMQKNEYFIKDIIDDEEKLDDLFYKITAKL